MQKICLLPVLLFIGLSFYTNAMAGSNLIPCDHEPTAEQPCPFKEHYRFTLQPVTYADPNGGQQTRHETTVYTMLVSDQFQLAPKVTVELYEVTGPENSSYAYMDKSEVDTEPSWNMCWMVFSFTRPGNFKLKAFIGDTLVAESLLNILP